MQDDRSVNVNADDLAHLAYFAAQGILLEVEAGHFPAFYGTDGGQLLAMAFTHGNLAADALGDELPYPQVDIVDALAGVLTRRAA